MAGIRDKAKKFQKFVETLGDKYPQALPEKGGPLLERFLFYLLFYANPAANAKKVIKGFTDDKVFSSWNEVRVATRREITAVLDEHKIEHADFLAPRIKQLLQSLFEEADDTAFEPLAEELETIEKAREKKKRTEEVRNFIRDLPGLPEWGPTYLLTGLGLDDQMPWDPYTEAVLDEQKVFPAKANLAQKKKVAKALLDGMKDLGPNEVHHLLIEHGKRTAGASKKR